MKRTLALTLCLFLALTALACKAPKSDNGKPNVIVTIFPQYDFIRQIAGDRVNLTMLAKPGGEVHGYDPTLSEMSEILSCDLFVYIGGETDRWVEDLLRTNGKDLNAVALVDLCETVDEELAPGMQDDVDGEADEHVWTSPQNAIRIVAGLTDALCALLPEEADAMRANASAYIGELRSLDDAFLDTAAHAQRSTIVFAERFPFRYLCEELGLRYYAALPGCSSNQEVAPSTVSYLIDRVREERLPCVFTIEFSDGRIARTIADATGCAILTLHSCHNVSREDFDAGVTYLDLMRQNLESLKKAVN